MHILADRNIPLIADACSGLGTVTLYDSTDPDALRDGIRGADALLCRSTVRVDGALLGGTPVRFVATATAGIEHVDTQYLQRRGITFASAAGSNALSVAEYVFAALFRIGARHGVDPRTMSIGIVGAGHVGSWVAFIAQRLGMRVVLHDPPLRDRTGGEMYRPLEEALEADIVTLHVPYTVVGPYPTAGMIDAARFAAMRDGAVFVNTARGKVIDPAAFIARAREGRFLASIMDVFPNEPVIDPALVGRADIATGHIAGHAEDGKLLGTQMVYESLCVHLGELPAWNYLDALPPSRLHTVPVPGVDADAGAVIDAVIRPCYDIEADDAALRAIAALPEGSRALRFQTFRNTYSGRREFAAHRMDARACDADVRGALRALGFTLVEEESFGASGHPMGNGEHAI